MGTQMVKGCKRQMVVVQTPESRWFKEACLILREDAPRPTVAADLLEEANRVVAATLCGAPEEEPQKRERFWLPFLLGGGLSGGVAALLLLLF